MAETGVATVYPTLLYDDAKGAIRLLTEGLGFVAEAVYEGDDGSVTHAELSCGNGRVMLGSRGREGFSPGRWRGRGLRGCMWWWRTWMRTMRGRLSMEWRS